MKSYHNLLKQAYYSCLQMTTYRKIRKDKAVRLFSDLVYQLTNTSPHHEKMIRDYHELVHYLMHLYGLENIATGDLWQNHILQLLLQDENIFSLACEKGQLKLNTN